MMFSSPFTKGSKVEANRLFSSPICTCSLCFLFSYALANREVKPYNISHCVNEEEEEETSGAVLSSSRSRFILFFWFFSSSFIGFVL